MEQGDEFSRASCKDILSRPGCIKKHLSYCDYIEINIFCGKLPSAWKRFTKKAKLMKAQ